MEFYTYIGRVKKTGVLRFLSNMEYMRSIERTLRRAKFPIWMTQGFHPRIKLSFPIALATGTVDLTGFFEFRMVEDIPKDRIKNLIKEFNLKAPKGLSMTNIWKVEKSGVLSNVIEYYEFKIIMKRSDISDYHMNKNDLNVIDLDFVKLKDFVVVEYIIARNKITKPENVLDNLISNTVNKTFYIPICYKAFDKNFNNIVKTIEQFSV
ncbi:MAG TPA: DUF2344 domain-containing protein [Thermotogaceae bacterium]|nr:DUF2344 domain-containing protein [Thermotogota bacterium]HEW92570.1 DUF2344 domain-containing protein [Thermotogaceae bacterium]